MSPACCTINTSTCLKNTIKLKAKWRLVYFSFSSSHFFCHFLQLSNVVDKPEELSAPTVYAAASSDGAVTLNLTVSSLAAKASAAVLLLAPLVIFQASFQDLSSMTCLNIEMIMLVPLEVSTLMMPLSMPLSLSLASAPPETPPQGRKKSPPSLVRLPTRPLVISDYFRF